MTAPETFERARSAPRNEMAPDALAEAALIAAPAQDLADAPLTDCPEMAPQAPENAQFAPGNSMAPDALAEAALTAAPTEDPLMLDAPRSDRPEMAWTAKTRRPCPPKPPATKPSRKTSSRPRRRR